MKTAIKSLFVLTTATILFQSVQAQSLSFSFLDLFSQQSKMRKIMTEQIVQVKLYASILKTGYRLTEEGLNLAHALKDGEFSLHAAYFTSLEQVNPIIRNNPKGKTISELDQQIREVMSVEWDWQQKQQLLRPDELVYFRQVRENLLAKCRLDMEELFLVLTPGKLQLTDAERLSRLDKLYERMKDKRAFSGSFTAKIRKLTLNRQQQQKDRDEMRKLYGIQ